MKYDDLKPLQSAGSSVYFKIAGLDQDISHHVNRLKFDGFYNNGFVARIQVLNRNFSLIRKFLTGDNDDFFKNLLWKPIAVTFKIEHSEPIKEGVPESRHTTGNITGYLAMIHTVGNANNESVEFVVVDKFSWLMRIGDGRGDLYEGTISEIITSVIEEFAPSIGFEFRGFEQFTDHHYFWQFRQSPRDFLNRILLEWGDHATVECKIGVQTHDFKNRSSSKADVIISTAGLTGESRVLGYYEHLSPESMSRDIDSWSSMLNISNKHDVNTFSGYTNPLSNEYSDNYKKQKLRPPVKQGRTNIPSIEVAGDINTQGFTAERNAINYVETTTFPRKADNGIGGINRVNQNRKTFSMRLVVNGHGIWNNTQILGNSCIYVDWRSMVLDGDPSYFLSGYWIVKGFSHSYADKRWRTTLDIYKVEQNSNGTESYLP
jgi:hypothetical protein